MTGQSGLRRFVGTPDPPPVERRPSRPEAEPCEMCGVEAGREHGHVVDVEERSLMCACRACYLLFTRPNAAGGRFRAIPERYLQDPRHPLTTVEWEGLGIPVGSVFFLRGAEGVSAFYPSPAGATECLLDLDAWETLGAKHPMLASAEPEVEAILIRSTEGSDDTVECYLVPIDACYQLVGLVRAYWQGFDGGQEAHEHIEGFFAGICSAAKTYTGER